MKINLADKIGGFIGVVMVTVFVLGIAYSISKGAAGFWGGLPFWCISVPIIGIAIYDYWDTCLRKNSV
jgi:hypothetical protein